MKLINLYVDPLEFFRKEALPDKTSLRGSAWTVIALMAIGMLDLYLTERNMFGFLARSIQANPFLPKVDKGVVLDQLQSIKPMAIASAGFAGFYPLFIWLAIPGLLANAAILLNRDYHFKEMLRCTGLAFTVFYPGQIASTIVLCWSPRVPYNPVLSSRNPTDLTTDLNVLSGMIRNGFPTATVRDFNLLGFIWFGIVLTIAFRELYRLKWSYAILSVWGLAGLFYGSTLLATHL